MLCPAESGKQRTEISQSVWALNSIAFLVTWGKIYNCSLFFLPLNLCVGAERLLFGVFLLQGEQALVTQLLMVV